MRILIYAFPEAAGYEGELKALFITANHSSFPVWARMILGLNLHSSVPRFPHL